MNIMSETKVEDHIILKDRLYTETDEWVKLENNVIAVGITDFAQNSLKI